MDFKTPAACKKNQGFALVLLLSLLPLLLTGLLGVAALIPMLRHLQVGEDHCRKGALNSQARLIDGLEELIKLSQVAEKLYKLESKALKAQRTSLGNPAAYKAATALLESIRAAQRALNARQAVLRLSTNRGAHALFKQATRDLHRAQKYLGSSFSPAPARVQGAELKVKVKRMGSSHIYEPLEPLEKLQVVRATWSFEPLAHFPAWAQSLFPSLGSLKIQCAASAKKKGDKQWEPLLNGVKRQWKS